MRVWLPSVGCHCRLCALLSLVSLSLPTLHPSPLLLLITQSWLRNWIFCMALYFGCGGAWAYYCYFCFGTQLYAPGHIPSFSDVMEQIKVAFVAMPMYAMLPALTEQAMEKGWTLAYARISDVGLPMYCLYFALYMTSVEFFVYWQHRILHNGVGYTKLHYIHHKYNKEHSLSPFAGLAFHPIDGILQAIPYTWTLFYVPMHQLTVELLLFATGVWTTNIHDCLHGKVEPIMGAGYHTIHHTTYKHNYGHYTIYMDKLFGTLITPEEFAAQQKTASSKIS
jgi:Delta7-sterol 5-desaturase